MKKLWKGMFMTPHLWESIYMAHRAGYDGCGAMILPREGKGRFMSCLRNLACGVGCRPPWMRQACFWTALKLYH